MPIDYPYARSLRSDGVRVRYDDRDAMLYALGVGMGRDPLDERELPFVFEGAGLKTIPTMLATLATGGVSGRDLGLNFALVVHGEQRLTLHRPMPPTGELIYDSRIVDIFDKGPGRGAVVLREVNMRLASDDQPLCTLLSTTFARGDGGCGGPSGSGPLPHPIPDRPPDWMFPIETRRDQALLYRLSGDRNPLHADPQTAHRAGFDTPILHGLCTYGAACRGIIANVCDYDPARIRTFDVRFSAPTLPGDRLLMECWREEGAVAFRCRVPDRDVVVINNGRCELANAKS
jgi:acyl dehydratase